MRSVHIIGLNAGPGWYLPGERGTCPGHWTSRYDTKVPILCCVMATRSCPLHWLYLQMPPCTGPRQM